MLMIVVMVEYPVECGEDGGRVAFALSPTYGAQTAEEAHAIALREWSSGVEPFVLRDADDEPWEFWRATVRGFLTASPSATPNPR